MLKLNSSSPFSWKRLVGGVALVASLAAAPFAHAETIRVFLVGGQSNTNAGYPEDLDPETAKPREDIPFYVRIGDEEKATGLIPLRPQKQFGPDLAFGHAMADFFGEKGDRVAILKDSKGGTNLHTQWAADGTASKENDGLYYKRFQQTVEEGLAALKEAHPEATLDIVGMLWVQGESDTGEKGSQEYQENLERFIRDVRLTFGEDLYFLVAALSSQQTTLSPEGFKNVRDAQAEVAEKDPRTFLLKTDDYKMRGDDLHYHADGMVEMGKDFAELMISILENPEASKQ